MADPRQNGFTLVEVLVATVIFVIVMSIIYSIYSSIEGQINKAETIQESLRIKDFLVRELAASLASAYVYSSPDNPFMTDPTFAFVSEDIQVNGLDADSLSFTSLAPPLGGTTAASGPKSVTITMEVPPEDPTGQTNSDDETEPTYLNLREQEWLSMGVDKLLEKMDSSSTGSTGTDDKKQALKQLFEQSRGDIQWTADQGMFKDSSDDTTDSLFDTEPVWSMEVMSFNLQFYDGVEWVDSWNSVEKMGLLPWAVKVQINFPMDEDDPANYKRLFMTAKEDKDYDFVAVVTLPAGYGLLPEDINYLAAQAGISMPRPAATGMRTRGGVAPLAPTLPGGRR